MAPFIHGSYVEADVDVGVAALADEDTLPEADAEAEAQGHPVRRTWLPPLRKSVPPGTDPAWACAR